MWALSIISIITTTEVNDPQLLQPVVVVVAATPVSIQTKKLDEHNVVIKMNKVFITK